MDCEFAVRNLHEDEEEQGADLIIAARGGGLRGVFVHQRAEGLGLGLVTPASFDDYRLLGALAFVFREYSGADIRVPDEFAGKMALYTDLPPEIPMFSDRWILYCMGADLRMASMALLRGDMPWVLESFNVPFVVGPVVMQMFGLYPFGKKALTNLRGYVEMMGMGASRQWELEDVARTAAGRCMVRNVVDPDEREAMENNDFTEEDARRIFEEAVREGNSEASRMFNISVIPIGDTSDPDPRLIAYGDFLSFFDLESGQQLALVPFGCVKAIVGEVPGSLIDECQYLADEPLDDARIAAMLGEAPVYMPPEPFKPAVFPGKGLTDYQKTYVLFWNPVTNPISTADFRKSIRRMLVSEFVWGLPKAGPVMGDRFLIVCSSPHQSRGIVASGVFVSNPYPRAASGEGNEVWVIDMKLNFAMDTRHPLLLTVDILRDAMPEVDWLGRSGVITLDNDQAATLEELWAPHLESVQKIYFESNGTDRMLFAVDQESCRY